MQAETRKRKKRGKFYYSTKRQLEASRMGRKKKDAVIEMAGVAKTLDFDRMAETSQVEKGEDESTKQYERRGKSKKPVISDSTSNNSGGEKVCNVQHYYLTP
jgi:hypothetical protein